MATRPDLADRNRTHGLSKLPEYRIWKSLRQRCLNPNNKSYLNYGGRGIGIDTRWEDFVSFLHDIGHKPGPNFTIERLDNDGPYAPENCCWATRLEQNKEFGEKMDRTLEKFFTAVRDSVEGHAKRKNYTSNDADGPNQLLLVLTTLGLHEPHALGEIIYKCAEMMKAPAKTKKLLCEKIAGWSWTIWRELPDE